MLVKIRSFVDGGILFKSECDNLKLCVEAAVKSNADLSYADLFNADLSRADLSHANLSHANLFDANLSHADLSHADLSHANLSNADLSYADLSHADLSHADLFNADLSHANLSNADLSYADLYNANLSNADLSYAELSNAKNMLKIMGVEVGNIYFKRFDDGLNNNGYQYKVGLNRLRDNEVFASDDRVTCSHPGFYFASRSWCAIHYPERPLEAKIRIPEGAKINEPWATDGKASADMIEILRVWDVRTDEDVTDKYR